MPYLKWKLPSGRSYFQSTADYSCGPMTILYVADYFSKNRNGKLLATEWIDVLYKTMNNNIWRKYGTRKESLVYALRGLGFKLKIVPVSSKENKLMFIKSSILNNRPVIISCLIKPCSKPERHYSVVVGYDKSNIYIHDPYPHNDIMRSKPIRIGIDDFISSTALRNKTVWGPKKWGVEVSV